MNADKINENGMSPDGSQNHEKELGDRLAALRGRLAAFESGRLAAAGGAESTKTPENSSRAAPMVEKKAAGSANSRAYSQGARVVSEFVGAIVVMSFIGWQVDRWFATAPVFLLSFLVLGAVAGFWTVYKASYKTSL